MLPDVLPYEPARKAMYPGNGRTLTDDAGGYFIGQMSNGKFKGDGLQPHTDLLDDFRYEGPPHAAQSAASELELTPSTPSAMP
jgi:hypothetical protein